MKIVEINISDYGSTGKIMLQIAEKARLEGHTVYTYSRGWKNQNRSSNFNRYFGTYLENGLHHIISFIIGYDGIGSYFGTKNLLKELDSIKPDIIHLHNLHGFYINYKLLFGYIKKNNIKTIWTLHDCWAFTGHCPYFDFENCNNWKNECHNCPKYKMYPESLFDNSKKMFRIKKKLFSDIPNLTIVTPSIWLSKLVKESFLKDYPVLVINNGIDLDIFKPRISNFREKYGIKDRDIVLLGVAFGWEKRKGLDDYILLSEKLDDRFKIVLVGTDPEVDKRLPKSIISINRTNDQIELAEIYSASDYLLNLSREDNYPTVNLEAIACNTPVLTYDTGGSPEVIDDSVGTLLDKNSIENTIKIILDLVANKEFKGEDFKRRSIQFNKDICFDSYIKLYKEEMPI